MENVPATENVQAEPGFFRQLAYAIGNFPVGLTSGVMSTWLMYYYCPPAEAGTVAYLSPATFGLIMFLMNIPSALADPTVGHFSDRTRSRWGRRMPYIIFGTPIMVLSFILMWYPPVQGISTANTVWMTGTVLIYFLSFTAVVNPYLAIMPEVWQTVGGRMSVSSHMTVTQGVGTLLAAAATGAAISNFPKGVALAGIPLNGYTFVAILGAILTVLGFLPTLFYIHETPYSANKEVPFNLLRSGWETLKNPAFLPYLISISLIGTSTTLIIAMIPYQVRVMGGSTEDMAGYLMGALMLGAMFCLPLVNWLVTRIPRRTLFLICCAGMSVIISFLYFPDAIPGLSPMIFMSVILILSAPFVSVFLVVPRTLLADVMDYDEQLTGYRREAMYNGMESLIGKVATGLAPAIMGFLFTWYGNSSQNPLGIRLCAVASGVITILAFAAFLFYPLRNK